MDEIIIDDRTKLQSLNELIEKNRARVKQIEEMEKEIALHKWMWKFCEDMSISKPECRDIFRGEIYNIRKVLQQIETKYNENKFDLEKRRINRQNAAVLSFIESSFSREVIVSCEIRELMEHPASTDGQVEETRGQEQESHGDKAESTLPQEISGPLTEKSGISAELQSLLTEKADAIFADKVKEIIPAKIDEVLTQKAAAMVEQAQEVLTVRLGEILSQKTDTILGKAAEIFEQTYKILEEAQGVLISKTQEMGHKAQEIMYEKAEGILLSRAPEVISEKAQCVIAEQTGEILKMAEALLAERAEEVIAEKAQEILAEMAQGIVGDRAREILAEEVDQEEGPAKEVKKGKPKDSDQKGKKGKAREKKGKQAREASSDRKVEEAAEAAEEEIEKKSRAKVEKVKASREQEIELSGQEEEISEKAPQIAAQEVDQEPEEGLSEIELPPDNLEAEGDGTGDALSGERRRRKLRRIQI